MSKTKFSEQEQKKLRNRAKSKLEELEKLLSDAETVKLLDSFKNKFNICETVYKVVLEQHQNSSKKADTGYLKVDMRQVPHALKFAGYSFDKTLLNELFGAKGANGKTAKKLRDAVTHGIDPKAIEEIKRRQAELFGYMDTFLETIRTFDSAQKAPEGTNQN